MGDSIILYANVTDLGCMLSAGYLLGTISGVRELINLCYV